MKKIILIILTILCILPVFSSCESEEGSEGLVYYLQDNGSFFVGCGKEMRDVSDVVIPSFYKGRPVTGIARRAFANMENLTSVSIPKTVRQIDYNAFQGCTSLKSITLPSRLESIGDQAFSYCTSLESIELPETVEEIGWGAFADCQALTEIVLPKKLLRLETDTFDGCSSLSSVKMNDGLLEIGKWAFKNCSALTEVTVPESVISIGDEAFDGCTAVKKVTLLGPEVVDASMFNNSDALTDVYIGDKVRVINGSCFSGCSRLQRVRIPDGIEKMYFTVFGGLNNIEYNRYEGGLYIGNESNPYAYLSHFIIGTKGDLKIHPDTKSIGGALFKNLDDPSRIILPDGIKYVDSNAFKSENADLFNEYGGVYYLGTADNPYYYLYIVKEGYRSSIEIHPDCEIIGDYAFADCDVIDSITIPKNVVRLSPTSFRGAATLSSIYVEDGSKSYKSIDGILYSRDGRTLICCPIGREGELTLQKGVRYIGDSAFGYCYELSKVSLPDGVRVIGRNAFVGCTALTELDLPKSLERIEPYAFEWTKELELVNYGASEEKWDEILIMEKNTYIITLEVVEK